MVSAKGTCGEDSQQSRESIVASLAQDFGGGFADMLMGSGEAHRVRSRFLRRPRDMEWNKQARSVELRRPGWSQHVFLLVPDPPSTHALQRQDGASDFLIRHCGNFASSFFLPSLTALMFFTDIVSSRKREIVQTLT